MLRLNIAAADTTTKNAVKLRTEYKYQHFFKKKRGECSPLTRIKFL